TRDWRSLRREQGLVFVPYIIEARRTATEITRHHGIYIVRAFAGVEHIGHEHGIVGRSQPDAAARQHQPIPFHVMTYLDDVLVFEKRLQRIKRFTLGDLSAAEPGRKQA